MGRLLALAAAGLLVFLFLLIVLLILVVLLILLIKHDVSSNFFLPGSRIFRCISRTGISEIPLCSIALRDYHARNFEAYPYF